LHLHLTGVALELRLLGQSIEEEAKNAGSPGMLCDIFPLS